MTSCVDIDEDIDLGFDVDKLTEILLDKVCDYEKCPYEANVNLIVTHSEEVRVYNKEYRDIDSTTDVLSFPALEIVNGRFDDAVRDVSDAFDPETGELILGDIVINADRVYSQAEEYGHSVKREFAFLVTHSLLHLCGYDHMDEESARIMEAKQEEILTALGILRE